MGKYFVPIAGASIAVTVASVLIFKIVLLSPDTHAHLWETLHPGYTRTAPILVGAGPVGDVELSLPTGQAGGDNPVTNDPGRAIYLTRGCSTCHGLEARGGPVGPSLAGSSYDVVERMVREGRGGMPAYSEDHLGAAAITELATYLGGLADASPKPEPGGRDGDSALHAGRTQRGRSDQGALNVLARHGLRRRRHAGTD